MAFDLGAMLKNVSGLDTEEQIQKIRLDLIDDDPENFYQLSGIDELADNIATCGLMDPIRVRQNPDDPERYMIVSGHRRRAAVTLLAREDPDKWASIACIVDSGEVSPALQQLRLIYANANTRVLSSSELNTQVQQVEQLLYKLKEEGYDFPGRMRDHVALACQVSKTKLARLKVIRENLFSDWQPSYREGKLVESTAYALAQMPPEWQHCIFVGYKGNDRDLRYLYESTVKAFGESFKRLEKIKCPGSDNLCPHIGNMRRHIVDTNRAYTTSCTGCCIDCVELRTCKSACEKAQPRKQELKDELRSQKAHEKFVQEEKDRPVIQYIQDVYQRVGNVRREKNISTKKLFEAGHRYFPADGEKEENELERGHRKITRSQNLPFGNCFTSDNAESICAVADLLGCSIDYLLGRTDDPNWPPAVKSELAPNPDTPGVWHYDCPPKPGLYIVMFEYSFICDTDICFSKWDGTSWDQVDIDDDDKVICWTYEPPKEPDTQKSTAAGWQAGNPQEVGTYIVICKYHPSAPEAVQSVFWDGEEWDPEYITEEVQIRRWIRKPEE